MIIDRRDIRGKDRLCVVIDGYRGIGPPEEGLGVRRAVVQLTLDLDIGPARAEGEAGDDLRTVHLIHITYRKSDGTVGILVQDAACRHICGGPVVLRPVEFYAAADPGSQQSHQCRLDDFVIVDEVIAVRLVIGPLYPAAQLRQHHDVDIFVLQDDRIVCDILLLIHDLVYYRIGVDTPAAALIDALFQEHRILVRLADAIGRNRYLLSVYPCIR